MTSVTKPPIEGGMNVRVVQIDVEAIRHLDLEDTERIFGPGKLPQGVRSLVHYHVVFAEVRAVLSQFWQNLLARDIGWDVPRGIHSQRCGFGTDYGRRRF